MRVFDCDTFEPCMECGHRSYAQAILPSGRDVVFCGHHLAENLDALILFGATINDQRSRILA